MDMDFLDDITFETDITLKNPAAVPIERNSFLNFAASRRKNIFAVKLLRLVFFLVSVFALVWACKYGIESFYCFCRGYENHMTIGQIVQEFKDYKAEQKAKDDRIRSFQEGGISR